MSAQGHNAVMPVRLEPFFFAYVLGAQKTHLIETVLLSTHNICFARKIRKLLASVASEQDTNAYLDPFMY